MENQTSWIYTINHYKDTIAEGFDLSLQLELAEKIANSEYASLIYPRLSHDTLCLTMISDYKESLKYPLICVQLIGKDQFKVKYFVNPTKTHNVSILNCSYSDVWTYLESLFLRLKLDSEKLEQST